MTHEEIWNHPGLILNQYGIEILHADWPIYPLNHGWESALIEIGNYPKSTIFFQIDDIDKCTLFSDNELKRIPYSFDNKQYFLALWHEDLIELEKRGFISGVQEATEFVWEKNNRIRVKQMISDDKNVKLFCEVNGKTIEIQNPTKKDYPENEKDFAVIKNGKIKITKKGIQKLEEIEVKIPMSKKISKRVYPLLKLEYYDTAIREATLLLEVMLKRINRSANFGQSLIDEHIKLLIKINNNREDAYIKVYRTRLRSIFKYIRNEFAHNTIKMDLYRTRCILGRISWIYDELLYQKKVISRKK